MTRPLRLEHLTIANFRGIRGELELNFSAPLIVMSAPNGTGKTSVCQAVEWLLTGQVEDLEDRYIACTLTDQPPTVTGTLRLGDETVTLRRIRNHGLDILAGSAWQRLSDVQWVTRLGLNDADPKVALRRL